MEGIVYLGDAHSSTVESPRKTKYQSEFALAGSLREHIQTELKANLEQAERQRGFSKERSRTSYEGQAHTLRRKLPSPTHLPHWHSEPSLHLLPGALRAEIGVSGVSSSEVLLDIISGKWRSLGLRR